MASQVAERYGEALFELAKESGELVRWGQQARCLAAVVEENPQLLDFFNAVKISAEEKKTDGEHPVCRADRRHVHLFPRFADRQETNEACR